MTDGEKTVPLNPLVTLHDELVEDFMREQEKLKNLMNELGVGAMESDPTLNYGIGRFVGARMVLSALRAHLAAQEADQTGKFDLLLGPIVDQVFEEPIAPRENLGDPGI